MMFADVLLIFDRFILEVQCPTLVTYAYHLGNYFRVKKFSNSYHFMFDLTH